LLLAAWVIAISVDARAEEAGQPRDEARFHFQNGLVLADANRFEEAAIEFERAYALSPRPAVLFNIAMAYANARRSARAVDYLRRYLTRAEAEADQRRVRDAQARLTKLMTVVGEIDVVTEPQEARVLLDGEPVTSPVILDPGVHMLEAAAEGFVPSSRSLRISQGERQTVRVALQRSEPPPVAAPALLMVRCNVPDVRITVDGNSIAGTPQSNPLLVEVGMRHVLLERPGYRSRVVSIDARASAVAVVDCELRPEQPLPSSVSSLLRVRPREVDAQIFLDEEPFPGIGRLPAGRHSLRVERPGYATWSTTLQLQPQRTMDIVPSLVATDLTRRTRERERKKRNWLVGTTAGAGLVLAGVTSWLVIDNHARYSTWEHEQRALDERWLVSTVDDMPLAQQRANDDRADRIKLQDEIAVGTGVAAGMLLIGAGALFFTGLGELPVSATVAPSRATASLSVTW